MDWLAKVQEAAPAPVLREDALRRSPLRSTRAPSSSKITASSSDTSFVAATCVAKPFCAEAGRKEKSHIWRRSCRWRSKRQGPQIALARPRECLGSPRLHGAHVLDVLVENGGLEAHLLVHGPKQNAVHVLFEVEHLAG